MYLIALAPQWMNRGQGEGKNGKMGCEEIAPTSRRVNQGA